MVRALASHQCGPGSNPGVDAICGLSLLLVLSLAPRGFSPGTPVFPSPQKPTFPNSNSTRNQLDEEPLCGCATSKSLLIYIYYLKYLNQNILNSPLALPTNVNLFLVSAGSLSSGETLFTGERREKIVIFLFEVSGVSKTRILSRTTLLKDSFVTDCKF